MHKDNLFQGEVQFLTGGDEPQSYKSANPLGRMGETPIPTV